MSSILFSKISHDPLMLFAANEYGLVIRHDVRLYATFIAGFTVITDIQPHAKIAALCLRVPID